MTDPRPDDPYERIAAEYAARWAGQPQAWLTDRLRRRFSPPALVADLGCGIGRDAAALQALGYRVVGLDGSRAMLAQAPASLRGRLVRADLRRLPLRSCVLAAAVSVGAHHHLRREEMLSALREARRTLRPGGTMVLSVKAGDGEEYADDGYGVARFFTYWREPALRARLNEAGLTPRDAAADGRWLTVEADAAPAEITTLIQEEPS